MTAARRVSTSCFGGRPAIDCVLDHCLDARLGCCKSSQVCWSRGVSRYFVSDSALANAECGLRRTVLREGREEALERTLRRRFQQPFFSCKIVWPCTRRMCLTRLTPRLSSRRANSVCRSWHTSPPIAVGSRRVRLPKNLLMFRLLRACLETLLSAWRRCSTPWSVFRNSNDRKTLKTLFRLSLSGCLGAWDLWS